jgi:hypothetical protein
MLGDEGCLLSPTETVIYYFNGNKVFEHDIEEYGVLFSSFNDAQERITRQREGLVERMYQQLKPAY